MRRIWCVAWCAIGLLGCDEGASDAEPRPDVRPVVDAAPTDAEPNDAGGPPPDAGPPDVAPPSPDAAPVDAAMPDAAQPDAAPMRCSAPFPDLQPSGPLPPVDARHAGIDAVETEAWTRLKAAVLADPGVHFVATYDRQRQRFVVDGGPPEARTAFTFHRLDGPDGSRYVVDEGDLTAIFPDTSPTVHPEYRGLLDALGNPNGVELNPELYAPGDPRVGWLPVEAQSWPDPMLRLGSLFEADDAPDAVFGVWPWASGGTGTHGGLGVQPSRSVFVVSGRGARQGEVTDASARLVDAAPTALAALAVPTTDGLGPDGRYDDGLYLRRQDGVVRWDALDPDPCVRPAHVVMVLFDGLLATEINHLMLADDPPIELPTFRRFAAEGIVYRAGAVVGFPSFSAPGHTTAGTGAWPGRHGVVGNAFYGRADGEVITPFDVLTDLPGFFGEPQRLYDLYERIVSGDVETVSEALERATDGDAFTVVLNEITIGGADYTPLDFFGIAAAKASVSESQRVDALGRTMVQAVLGDRTRPVPDLLQLSLLATDAAGENAGPHSDLLRDVLLTMDGHLAAIRAAYEQRGALDHTMFILVADHGMELQDPTRRANVGGAIRNSGVRTRYVGSGGIWLANLALMAEATDAGVAVRVVAHDDGQPVAGAMVTCAGCDPVETDADGRAELPAGADGIEASHPAFNPARL